MTKMTHSLISGFAFLALITAQHAAFAFVGCPARKDIIGDLAAVNAPIQITQIDDADRRTAVDYAADHNITPQEVKQRYAASGDINCNGKKSSASVTVVGDVITTAAHSINAGGEKCVELGKNPKCTFTVEVAGDKITYDTAELVESGWDCNSTDRKHPGSDWAVIRLSKKVDSRIKPYRIDRNFRLRMKFDTPVTAIGRSQDWPPNIKSNDLWDHPRHYGDCQTKQPIGSGVETNCDISGGSSGGALLTQGPDPIIVGVHESNVLGGDDCPKPNYAKRKGPWSICWANKSSLIAADFADAVEKAARESNARP